MEEERRRYNREYMRAYNQTPKGHRYAMFKNWKKWGLKGDLDAIYDHYIATTNCDRCNHLLTKGKKGGREKQMDHDHRTLEFRAVLCGTCNLSDTTRLKQKNQKYGHKGLTFVKKKGLWSYRKENKEVNMKVSKLAKSKTKILCIKFAFLILLNHKLKSL